MNEDFRQFAEDLEKVTNWLLVIALVLFGTLGFIMLPYVWR
jgi:hypothetical protein